MSRVDDAYRRLHPLPPDQPPAEDASPASPENPESAGNPGILDRYSSEGPAAAASLRRRASVARHPGQRPNGAAGNRRAPGRADRGGAVRRPLEFDPARRLEVPAQGFDLLDARGDGDRSNPTSLMWGALRILGRRKWLLLAAFILSFASGTFFLKRVKPVFRATTRLTVENRTATDALLKATPESAPQQGYLETMAEVLRSRSLAESAATKLALWEHPEYAPFAGGSTPGATAAPEGVVSRLMSKMTVTGVPGSTVLNVAVESGDPELAAKAANTVAQAFIERDLESRLSGAKDATNWIGRQLEEQRARVTETEAALQRYRESQNASSLDERQNIVVQRLSDLNTAVTRARTERISKEALYKQVEGLKDQQNLLDTVPAVASSGYIQQLKAQVDQLDRELREASVTLGEKHPDIIRLTAAKAEATRRLSAEIGTVAASLRNDFLTAQAQEQSLTAALDAQKSEAQDLDRKGVEYAALVREAESNRALYQSLLEQAKNVGLSSDLQRSNVRILDSAAVPRSPINPIGRLGLLLSAIGSLVFAAGLVFVAEYLDPRLRTVDEVSDQLGLPLLGYVEQLRKKDATVAGDDLPPRFLAAVDRVRVGIEGQAGPQGGVLLVTSAGPKEGKTFVASNLATAFALAGRRVLLIDCDLRRSRVHEVFGLAEEPGLTTTLAAPETVAWTSVVQPGPCSGLSIMTAGPTPANPAEVLGSQAFADFLADARQSFDWIVIDSPPTMAVADAQMLTRLADDVMFVAAADLTRRNAARLAVAQLRRTRAPLVGVVLNRVALPRFGAFYSPYYNSAYDSYYTRKAKS